MANGRASRGATALIVVGGLLLAAGVGLFVAGFVLLARDVVDTVDRITDFRDELDADAAAPSTVQFEVQQGVDYDVFAIGSNLVYDRCPGSETSCSETRSFTVPEFSISGPTGRIDISGSGGEVTYDLPGTDAVKIGSFTAAEAATYTITVGPATSEVTAIGVGEGIDFGEEVEDYIANGVAITVGGLVFTVGLLALIGGIIWRVVSGSGGGGSAPPGGFGGPQWRPGPLPPQQGWPPQQGYPPGYGPPPGWPAQPGQPPQPTYPPQPIYPQPGWPPQDAPTDRPS